MMLLKPRFSKSDTVKLLLVSAFPVHFWAILMVFKEADTWMTKRSIVYSLGASGYVLGLALLESLLLFGFIYLLSFLFPKNWSQKANLTVAAALALITAGWAIANQVYFFLGESPSHFYIWLHLWTNYRQTIAYLLFWLVMIASVAAPVLLLARSEKAQSAAQAVIEKVILLAPLYLLFDLVGIVFTVIRNLT
ncbi:MAG: hypothetical protein P8046_10000 [Anaerolineales bacterium]|jgi:hypothetical protein